MQADKLANEVDRKHAEREERRKRVRFYKDRPTQKREREFTLDSVQVGYVFVPTLDYYERTQV